MKKTVLLLLLVLSCLGCSSTKKTVTDNSVTQSAVKSTIEYVNDSTISSIIQSSILQMSALNIDKNESSRIIVYDTILINGEQLMRYTIDHNVIDNSTSLFYFTAEHLNALIKDFNNKLNQKIDSVYKYSADIKTTEQKKTDGCGWLIWLSIGVGIPVVIYFLIKSNIFVKIFSKIFV